jgi:hypothetical protein
MAMAYVTRLKQVRDHGRTPQLPRGAGAPLAEPYGIVHKVSADLLHRRGLQTPAAYDASVEPSAENSTGPVGIARRARCDPTYPEGWALLAFAHLDDYLWYGSGPLYRQPVALDQGSRRFEPAGNRGVWPGND